jgi:hypothetical protein
MNKLDFALRTIGILCITKLGVEALRYFSDIFSPAPTIYEIYIDGSKEDDKNTDSKES